MADTGKVLVFGAAGLDTIAQASLRDHESVPGTVLTAAGGVGCNIAINLARLDVPVSLVSRIGDDAEGRQLKQTLTDAGVDTRFVTAVRGASTARYVALLNEDGNLHRAVSAMDVVETLDAGDAREALETTSDAAAVIADANLPENTLSAVLAADSPTLRCADTVSAAKAHRLGNCLERLDVLKSTPAESAALTGIDASNIDALCGALLDRGVAAVYLSLGGDGLYVATRSETAHLPATTVSDVHSTSGAGDALLSGIVLGRLLGESELEAGRLGLEAAAHTLTASQSTSPTLDRSQLIDKRSQRAANA